ncbi:hypothetical protein JCM30471_01730 [Desulfuromonas carbonis]
MSSPLTTLAVILCEPQQPGNIGAVARAMANFGVTDLRLVRPCAHLHPEARKFAAHGHPLLGQARLFADLDSALNGIDLSIAATCRSGRLRGELLDSTRLPELVAALPAGARTALVFGREDRGLATAEVALCTRAVAIATFGPASSFNLAQAVLVFLYELARRP